MDKLTPPAGFWRMGKQLPGRPILWTQWQQNKICKGYAELVGKLLTQSVTGNAGTVSSPTLQIVLSSGEAIWDVAGTPPPDGTETTAQLTEFTGSRKTAEVLGYRQDDTDLTDSIEGLITSGAGSPVTVRRPILTANWTDSEIVSPRSAIREVALCGGTSGNIMLNLLRFPVIYKDADNPYTMHWEVELQINY